MIPPLLHGFETQASQYSAVLGPWAYAQLQRLLGSRNFDRWLVREQLRPKPGQRILDIGCGPAEIVAALPRVQYLGLDLNPKYVEAARRRFGNRGRFLCRDVREVRFPEHQRFDLVLVKEVVHHLDDAGAERLMELAATVLTDSGRLVTVDPALDAAERPLARWLIRHDAGGHIREPAAYRGLAESWFEAIDMNVRQDLLRVPYTLAILTCRKPRRSS
jgi:SAM-dependent methyltransferase